MYDYLRPKEKMNQFKVKKVSTLGNLSLNIAFFAIIATYVYMLFQ